MTYIGDIVVFKKDPYIVSGVTKEDVFCNLWSLSGSKEICNVSVSQMQVVHTVRSVVEPNYKFDDIVVFRAEAFTGVARFEGEASKTEVDVQETYEGECRTLQRADIMYMAPAHVREAFLRRWNDAVERAIAKKEKELEILNADFL
jgi:hypothetical protein